MVVRAARRESAPLRPDLPGIRQAGRAGVPLIMRTLMLRASLLVMTYAAARLGDADLATMQLALTIWTFLAFTLDAVAIAAQAITGRYLGAGDADGHPGGDRADGALGLAQRDRHRPRCWPRVSPLLGRLFTSDPVVQDLLVPVLLVAAARPAGRRHRVRARRRADRRRRRASTSPGRSWSPSPCSPRPRGWSAAHGLVWLWVAFSVFFMGGRAVTLLLRARGDRWMRLGA